MLTRARMLELSRLVDDLTRRHPPGTPCRFWPGAREGEGRPSRIRSAWLVTQSGEVAVFVEGYPGYIAATHVKCGPEEPPRD
jgi:hypothetical protein